MGRSCPCVVRAILLIAVSDYPAIAAVDLFCGIGGLTCGLLQAKISVRAGFDLDDSCAFAYERNNKGARFFHRDIAEISPADIRAHFAGADFSALVGCAPCQPFSRLRENRREKPGVDRRWALLNDFAKLVRETMPDVVSMENVPGLRRRPIYDDFVRALKECGYQTSDAIVDCVNYGVPQNRKRLVVLASRRGKITMLPPAPKKQGTVGGAIGIMRGKTAKDDPAHISYNLSEKNRRRIRASKPGGSWRDWDSKMVSPCHGKRGHDFPSPYGRMRPDAPAPTITTQFCFYSCGRFGHPKEDRAVTVREGALLQSFGRGYALFNKNAPLQITQMARHIGNAVPPKLGLVIGKSIVHHLRKAA